MNILLVLLSLLDLIAGIALLCGIGSLVFLGWLCIAKGVFSVLSSTAVGYYFDWMGWIDILAGLLLVLKIYSFFGWFLVIKGIYSLVSSFF